MFSQFLITIILIAVIGYLLWKCVGKPYIKKYGIDKDDLPTLQRKIKELERKREEIVALKQEIETTTDLNKIDNQLAKFRNRLAKLESKRTEQAV